MSTPLTLPNGKTYMVCRDETGAVKIFHQHGTEVEPALAATLRCMAEAALQKNRPELVEIDAHWLE